VASSGVGSWTQSGNNIANSNTGNVGIGTVTPPTGTTTLVVKSPLSGGQTMTSFLNGSGVEQASVTNNGTITAFRFLVNGASSKIEFNGTNAGLQGTSSKYILNRTSNWELIGLAKYDIDYSGSYDTRSLVDKGYVDSKRVQRVAQYTVSTLPAGVQGDTAYVTDALAPTYLAVVVGGGAVVSPVFYNGTAWVSH
jgi:hypothetical protein